MFKVKQDAKLIFLSHIPACLIGKVKKSVDISTLGLYYAASCHLLRCTSVSVRVAYCICVCILLHP